MIKIEQSSDYKKLDANKKQVIKKAAKKLELFIKGMDNFKAKTENNEIIINCFQYSY